MFDMIRLVSSLDDKENSSSNDSDDQKGNNIEPRCIEVVCAIKGGIHFLLGTVHRRHEEGHANEGRLQITLCLTSTEIGSSRFEAIHASRYLTAVLLVGVKFFLHITFLFTLLVLVLNAGKHLRGWILRKFG